MAAEAATGVEAELHGSVQQLLQRHVGTALAAVCPAEVAVLCANMLQVPRERVRPATRTGGGDLVCHAPVAVYRRLQAKGNQREGNLEAAVHMAEPAADNVDGGDGQSEPAPGAKRRKQGHNTPLRLTKTSEFGLTHERWYATEMDFAEAIVQVRVPSSFLLVVARASQRRRPQRNNPPGRGTAQALPSEVYALAADVRVLDGGVVCFTTRMHMEVSECLASCNTVERYGERGEEMTG